MPLNARLPIKINFVKNFKFIKKVILLNKVCYPQKTVLLTQKTVLLTIKLPKKQFYSR